MSAGRPRAPPYDPTGPPRPSNLYNPSVPSAPRYPNGRIPNPPKRNRPEVETRVVLLTFHPHTPLEDESTTAGEAWAATRAAIKGERGVGNFVWARTEEREEVVVLMIGRFHVMFVFFSYHRLHYRLYVFLAIAAPYSCSVDAYAFISNRFIIPSSSFALPPTS